MRKLDFKIWFEEVESNRAIIFLDFNETLIHNMEVGWLKDSPTNKHYAKILIQGKAPYKNVVSVKENGKEMQYFPRPGLDHFLQETTKFADLYILTHSEAPICENAIKALNIDKYIKDVFHTGKLEPGELGKKFDLSNKKWVLVDNLGVNTLEMVNKLRILGLNFPNVKPKQEAKKILAKAQDHFIDVADWIPTAEEFDDYELWRIIPKIKYKLGLNYV